jgi:hypothetical protein
MNGNAISIDGSTGISSRRAVVGTEFPRAGGQHSSSSLRNLQTIKMVEENAATTLQEDLLTFVFRRVLTVVYYWVYGFLHHPVF